MCNNSINNIPKCYEMYTDFKYIKHHKIKYMTSAIFIELINGIDLFDYIM